ncbi:hypothetical protein N0V93_003381 [Gnomoniopsis smithogilvyi]|uniref:Uncharacterized protein n=1 Tax=Gnomoniopsis smithogilvyi TaxID=1191159 RepID=A0A9W8YY79_9PEZI|nr:hypothetical protein N0V93_003381 [Gnomoniopsis smithogilvyi]
MPIRNPFTRRQADDGALRPPLNIQPGQKTPPGFERIDTVGSKASSSISISSRQSQDKGEYKMSVVNDSGVYLPPSPTAEDKASWPRRYLSRNSTDTRSELGEIEPFGISRESFDSYRRSFDICAKSPVVNQDSFPTRRSMDSTRFPRMPRQRLFEREPPSAVAEGEAEGFEEVGLNEEEEKPYAQQLQAQQAQPQPKKRGFFSKFSDHNQDNGGLSPIASPSPTTSRFSILPNRKRGQSIQGAELSPVDRSQTDVHDNAKEMMDIPSQA